MQTKRRVVSLGLILSLLAVLFIVPSATVRAEESAEAPLNGVISYEITDQEPVVAVDREAEIKEQLSEKIGSLTEKLYGGITYLTLNDCGKRVSGFIGAFSEGYDGFKKEQEKKKAAANAAKSSSNGNREHSDVLVYKYNPAMDIDVTDEEFEILCRITEAEAGDQDVYGRILVVNVILNRVNWKKEFANDIEGVVFEKGQFSPISNGAYYRVVVDDVTKEAVTRALEGEDYSDGALYFFMRSGTSKSAAAWFDSLEFVLKYGCHEFFKEN